MPIEKMPVRPFLEAVEKRLAGSSREELQGILRAMALRAAPAERLPFLEQLRATDSEPEVRQTLGADTLLTDVEDLVREMKAQEEHSDGWHEAHDDWSDEGDTLGPYAAFVGPLVELFGRAAVAFDSGDLPLARASYDKLFTLLATEDAYGQGVQATDLQDADVEEARARYLRAVYETEQPSDRPRQLFEQIVRLETTGELGQSQLGDLIDVSSQPLPDQVAFLKDWIAFLRKEKAPAAERLLREAIRLAEGTTGLAAHARKEGRKHPRAYLDWVAALGAEGKPSEVLTAATEALRKLDDEVPLRALIADHLCAAAKELRDLAAEQRGRWEAFAARPLLTRLLDLYEVTPPSQRARRLRDAERHLERYLKRESRSSAEFDGMSVEDRAALPGWVTSSVLAHAHLLNGNWDAAREMANDKKKVLGWSSPDNPQGVVVPAFLALLNGDLRKLPPNVARLWDSLLAGSAGGASSGGKEADRQRLEAAYTDTAHDKRFTDKEAAALLAWCVDIGQRRASAIVGEQHRHTYDRAATVVVACAEVLRTRDQLARADGLLRDVRSQFPRHRSFQDALNRAVALSRRS